MARLLRTTIVAGLLAAIALATPASAEEVCTTFWSSCRIPGSHPPAVGYCCGETTAVCTCANPQMSNPDPSLTRPPAAPAPTQCADYYPCTIAGSSPAATGFCCGPQGDTCNCDTSPAWPAPLPAPAPPASGVDIGAVSLYIGNSTTRGERNKLSSAQFWVPRACQVNPADDNLYILDGDGVNLRLDTPGNDGSAQFSMQLIFEMRSMRWSADGKSLFLAVPQYHIVYRYQFSSSSTMGGGFAGTYRTAGDADGTGTQASFNVPIDLAIDLATSDLFVAERDAGRVRKVSAAAVVSQYSNGHASPTAINRIQSDGRIFTYDASTIAETATDGTFKIVAGSTEGANDGDGTAAKFGLPFDGTSGAALTVDPTEQYLFIADNTNHAIRRMLTVAPYTVVTVIGAAHTLGWSAGSPSYTATIAFPTATCFSRDGTTLFVVGNSAVSAVAYNPQTAAPQTTATPQPTTTTQPPFSSQPSEITTSAPAPSTSSPPTAGEPITTAPYTTSAAQPSTSTPNPSTAATPTTAAYATPAPGSNANEVTTPAPTAQANPPPVPATTSTSGGYVLPTSMPESVSAAATSMPLWTAAVAVAAVVMMARLV